MSKKALVVWGGWDGHTPKQSVNVFVPWMKEQGFEVTVSDNLDPYADEALMDSLSVIVQSWTMGSIAGPQSQGLSKAVEAGVGLVGWHGGLIDSFRMDTGYQFMTGGQWVAHPGGCIPSYDVRIRDAAHPITWGLKGFTLRDTEQYYIHVDPAVHVLCETVFEGRHGETWAYPAGTVMPYAYTRMWGKGRVFCACWGHTFKDFEVPEALEMVRRGILWAAR
jgi:hypothetical protein